MNTTTLKRRIDKLAPPPPPIEPYIAPAIDPQLIAQMRKYLAGQPIDIPGADPAVLQAMNDFLAEQ